MMASSRTAWTSSGRISGSGLASAKMMGSRAMEATMSWLTTPAAERPMKTSAPSMASARVRSSVSTAKGSLNSFMSSVRPS